MPITSPTPPEVLLGGFPCLNIVEIEPFRAKLAKFPQNGLETAKKRL
jgi:hypothetical protein